jgi:hypothetical protein
VKREQDLIWLFELSQISAEKYLAMCLLILACDLTLISTPEKLAKIENSECQVFPSKGCANQNRHPHWAAPDMIYTTQTESSLYSSLTNQPGDAHKVGLRDVDPWSEGLHIRSSRENDKLGFSANHYSNHGIDSSFRCGELELCMPIECDK